MGDLFAMLSVLHYALLGFWLEQLYLKGFMFMGFWGGLDPPNICARIAKHSEASDWVSPVDGITPLPSCTAMIDRGFQSFSVTVHTCLYLASVMLFVSGVRHYCAQRHTKSLVREILPALRDAIQPRKRQALLTHAQGQTPESPHQLYVDKRWAGLGAAPPTLLRPAGWPN